MNFLSVKEFFYKINTIGFILLLMPVMVFVILHFSTLDTFASIYDPGQQLTLLASLGVVVLIGLTIVHWLWSIRINRLRGISELSRKMDGYFVLVVIRNGAYAAGSLMMAVGYYMTHSPYFTGFFIVMLLALLAQWPSPARFCLDFKLRGTDRDLVLHNQDLPRKSRRT